MAIKKIPPSPDDARLYREVSGFDHYGNEISAPIIIEKPLTIFLNAQEIVTLMSICDYPDLLAVGYLVNQNMLQRDDKITAIEYEEDIDTIVIRTDRTTDYENKLKKKILTSGCGQGTIFGDLLEKFDEVRLSDNHQIETSWLYSLIKTINLTPRLYLKTGAIHGCVLCHKTDPIIYMEDVGRHNAVDKVAGFMFLNNVKPEDKIFYTTGRLTSEMVIKSVKMELPILISRSGFTAWGVELARKAGQTLIGRARGKRFIVLSGKQRIIYNDPDVLPDKAKSQKYSASVLFKS